MKSSSPYKIRLERQAHREAVRRLYEALKRAQQAGQEYEEDQTEKKDQEEEDADPSCAVCPGIDITTRAGSHN